VRRRWKLCLGSLLFVLIGALLLPSVHWPLIGWWQGEAFFQNRPTSYWRQRIHRYYEIYYGDEKNLSWFNTLTVNLGIIAPIDNPSNGP
jgi:hypothetical protein